MKPILLFVGLALLVAGAVYHLLSEDREVGGHEARPDAGVPSAPALIGGRAPSGTSEPEVQAADTPPLAGQPFALRGSVHTSDGKPVQAADVYVLSKTLPGADKNDQVRLAQSNAQGKWSLAGNLPGRGGLSEHWIGVLARGCHMAHVDGADIRPDVNPAITLEAFDPLLIHVVVPDGGSVDRMGAWIATPDDIQTFRFPGPAAAASWSERILMKPTTRFQIAAPSGSPAVVWISADGYYAEPATHRLDLATGEVTFHLRDTCTYMLTARDAENGSAIAGVSIELLDARTRERVHQSSASSHTGVFHSVETIRPGRYVMVVESDGYERWMSGELSFHNAGDHRDVSADIRLDSTKGSIRLRLDAKPLDERSAVFYQTLVRRAGVGDGSWGFEPPFAVVAGKLEARGVPVGTYDVLVWRRPTDEVGVALGLRVGAQSWTERTVVLRPGLSLELAGHWPSGASTVRLELLAPRIGRLPLVQLQRGSMGIHGETKIEILRKATLGPFPVESAEAHHHHTDGKSAVVTWPR